MRRQEARQPGVAGREQRIGTPLGERGELADGEPEVVERERERLAVEVAARAGDAVLGEQQRVARLEQDRSLSAEVSSLARALRWGELVLAP